MKTILFLRFGPCFQFFIYVAIVPISLSERYIAWLGKIPGMSNINMFDYISLNKFDFIAPIVYDILLCKEAKYLRWEIETWNWKRVTNRIAIQNLSSIFIFPISSHFAQPIDVAQTLMKNERFVTNIHWTKIMRVCEYLLVILFDQIILFVYRSQSK